jgi:hypothetical protein
MDDQERYIRADWLFHNAEKLGDMFFVDNNGKKLYAHKNLLILQTQHFYWFLNSNFAKNEYRVSNISIIEPLVYLCYTGTKLELSMVNTGVELKILHKKFFFGKDNFIEFFDYAKQWLMCNVTNSIEIFLYANIKNMMDLKFLFNIYPLINNINLMNAISNIAKNYIDTSQDSLIRQIFISFKGSELWKRIMEDISLLSASKTTSLEQKIFGMVFNHYNNLINHKPKKEDKFIKKLKEWFDFLYQYVDHLYFHTVIPNYSSVTSKIFTDQQQSYLMKYPLYRWEKKLNISKKHIQLHNSIISDKIEIVIYEHLGNIYHDENRKMVIPERQFKVGDRIITDNNKTHMITKILYYGIEKEIAYKHLRVEIEFDTDNETFKSFYLIKII